MASLSSNTASARGPATAARPGGGRPIAPAGLRAQGRPGLGSPRPGRHGGRTRAAETSSARQVILRSPRAVLLLPTSRGFVPELQPKTWRHYRHDPKENTERVDPTPFMARETVQYSDSCDYRTSCPNCFPVDIHLLSLSEGSGILSTPTVRGGSPSLLVMSEIYSRTYGYSAN